MGRMLSSGELLSSIGLGATKLKPLKSWWALALGGIPGESDVQQIIHYTRSHERVVEGQGQLCKVEFHIFLCKHNLIRTGQIYSLN
ncbi:hypothetical protein EYF80_028755 [Liparis tanakae]|uniref:Uncharacterized protein n=1 Tax=Liparis tanakae TaxID=230148 RepID=A0A4Z2H533_9TELE|nr:hypothetical protein EYF80_028755 [Liparis tanakae]